MHEYLIRRLAKVAFLIVTFAVPALGQDTADGIVIVMPVQVEGRAVVEAQVRVTPEGVPIAVETAAIEEGIRTLTGRTDALSHSETGDGFVSLERLQEAGLRVTFDRESVALVIEVPAMLRAVRELSLIRAPRIPGDTVDPAIFSAYLNIAAGAALRSEAGAVAVPVSLDLMPVFSLGGVVLESDLSYRFDGEHVFTAAVPRLTVDRAEEKLRATAGAVFYEVGAFGAKPDLYGLSVGRYPDLHELSAPPSPVSLPFVLEEEREVSISLNGRVLDTTTLSPGRYEVTNFPLGSGINTLSVSGPPGGVSRRVPYDARLERAGEHDFSYALGLRDLSIDSLVFSMMHRYGLLPTLTGQAAMQIGRESATLSGGGLWAGGLGTFGLNLAGGHFADTSGTVFDGAVSLTYRLGLLADPVAPVLDLGLSYLGPRFSPLVDQGPTAFPWTIDIGYAQSLPIGLSFTMAGRLRANLDASLLVPELRASFRLSLPARTTLVGRVSAVFSAGAAPELEGTLTLTSSAVQETTVSLRHTFADSTEDLSFFYTPELAVGALSVGGVLSGVPFLENADRRLSLRGIYRGPRLQGGMAYETWAGPGAESGNHRVALDLAGALVFADGYFGWSRPVSDSFALVVAEGEMAQERLLVNPVGDRHSGSTEFLDHVVVPTIGAHARSRIEIVGPEMALGRQLDRNEFDLVSGYRSGTLIRIRSDARVFVSGVFVDVDGAPLALRTGYLLPAEDGGPAADGTDAGDEPDGATGRVDFFTNRDGEFFAYGIAPGTYDLYMSDVGRIGRFEVGRAEAGLVELGVLVARPEGPGSAPGGQNQAEPLEEAQ